MIFQITNNTTLNPNNIFILISGTKNNRHCYVHIKNSHEQQIIYLHNGINSEHYASKLTDIENSKGKYTMLLEPLDSGRIYFSIDKPMKMGATCDGKSMEADPFDITDSNYNTVYDKIEFTYNENGIWINPTAVDFFSIPIKVSIPNADTHCKESGFSNTKKKTIEKIKSVYDAHTTSKTKKVWDKTFLYKNDTVLRIMAPGKMMTYYNENSLDRKFTDRYLTSDYYGFNYVDFVWNYYKTHKLMMNCSELETTGIVNKLNDYIFVGSVVDDVFLFKNKSNTYFVELPRPCCSSCLFLAGSGNYCHENNTYAAVIIKFFTSIFSVGLLPLENENVIVGRDFFENIDKNLYYQHNKLLPANTGPWYDLYSKAIHSATELPVYTFAYDDALCHDGTLHARNKVHVNITLQSLAQGEEKDVEIYTDKNDQKLDDQELDFQEPEFDLSQLELDL